MPFQGGRGHWTVKYFQIWYSYLKIFHLFFRRHNRRKQVLTSLVLISSHPFLSSFRTCLAVLKRLVDSCSKAHSRYITFMFPRIIRVKTLRRYKLKYLSLMIIKIILYIGTFKLLAEKFEQFVLKIWTQFEQTNYKSSNAKKKFMKR